METKGKTPAIKKTYINVLNIDGQPLMPTTRCGHVRRLLDKKQARVVSTYPFTIQLNYSTPDVIQELKLGIDPGRENIGLAVANKAGECMYLAEADTHNGSIKKVMSDRARSRHKRRHYDRQKRQRKACRRELTLKYGTPGRIFKSKKPCLCVETTYPRAEGKTTQRVIRGKEAKFANRRKEAGWLTPSGRQLKQMHLLAVEQVCQFLPISGIVLEWNNFHPKNSNLQEVDDAENSSQRHRSNKEYIWEKQEGKCLLCGDSIEQYHHIVPRSKGGSNSVKNVVGLCSKCHVEVHKDEKEKDKLARLTTGQRQKFKVELLKRVMPQLIEGLKDLCEKGNFTFELTSGPMTYRTRNAIGAAKGHAVDAYCAILGKAGKVFPSQLIVPTVVHNLNRYKKKSANIIIRKHNREYSDGDKVVATNRGRRIDQEAPSLEDHMSEYAETHTTEEFWDHLRQLTVKPAKREYTHRKNEKAAKAAGRSTTSMRDINGNLRVFHPGDTVLYERTRMKKVEKDGRVERTPVTEREVFVVKSIEIPFQRLIHIVDGKRKYKRAKYCRILKGGALVCTGTRPLTEIE